MQKNSPPDESGGPPTAPDGPLTQVIQDQAREADPAPANPPLPGAPDAKRQGQDDYARGTSEHEDDRET